MYSVIDYNSEKGALEQFYQIEYLQSLDDAVDDLIVCCLNNGGTLR